MASILASSSLAGALKHPSPVSAVVFHSSPSQSSFGFQPTNFTKLSSKKINFVVRAEEGEPKEAVQVKTRAKGDIVRVDKELYLKSVEALAVDHPPYFSGLSYIYEARGEVLDVRFFEAGEYCLISWVGIPTAPAWLPAYMLIKAPKLDYVRV